MKEYLSISGFISLSDIGGRTFTGDELREYSSSPFSLVVEDFVYRLENDAFDTGCIDIDDALTELGIDPDTFNYDEFTDFLIEFLTKLGEDVEIQDVTFQEFDDGGYDYDATLNYKIADLIEKFIKE